MQKRTFRVWWLLLAVLAAAFVMSGCNRMTAEEAQWRFDEGRKREAENNLVGALANYEAAAKGRFNLQAQALTDAARVAVAVKEYDKAIQSYTLLVQQFPFQDVNFAAPGEPENKQKVREYVGTFADHNPNGPFYAAEKLADEKNKSNWAYKTMDFLVALTGRNPYYSYALAILIFTIVVKVAMTPLTKSQLRSTIKMQAVQPKMKVLQDQYKDKPEELNKAVMRLYKEEGVNPFGCAMNMLVQFPILIGLYQVIRLYNFQFRQGYFLWITEKFGAMAPGIIGKNLAQPDTILLVLYAVSMYVSTKISSVPTTDPQARQQQQMMSIMMPVMFLFVLKSFPSAFILYWLVFNILSTWQTFHLMKAHAHHFATPAPGNGTAAAVDAPADKTPAKGPARTAAKRKRK